MSGIRDSWDGMENSLDRSFGLAIAFLLPGFIAVIGVGTLSPTVASWLAKSPVAESTIGEFLYVGILSLSLGMISSAIRWLLIDSLHRVTGVEEPCLNFSHLQKNLDAFELAVHHNYRYYQFYANTCVSLVALAACSVQAGWVWTPMNWIGFATLEIVLMITGRDCLKRYYDRIRRILGTVNGAH